jgi:CRISPR system Cascade subunit CasD
MSVLLLCFIGPMQSWGIQSRFSIRDTGLEPSKSGVVGVLCAALGRPRAIPVIDLAALRMGVRVDREGRMAKDYHTTGGQREGTPGPRGVLKAGGGLSYNAVLSTRFYLADAAFLVGLEGDLELLRKLDRALADPVWSLFLGRKAFPPSVPIRLPDGLRETETLESALRSYPRLTCTNGEEEPALRIVLEDAQGEAVRVDQPLSFAERRFTQRRVTTKWVAGGEIPARKES